MSLEKYMEDNPELTDLYQEYIKSHSNTVVDDEGGDFNPKVFNQPLEFELFKNLYDKRDTNPSAEWFLQYMAEVRILISSMHSTNQKLAARLNDYEPDE